MPEIPTYKNISTPGFTRTPTAPADTEVQQALFQVGSTLANIGTKILGDFKKKQEISQYSTAQTDAIVAMNNLQAELLLNADYTKHEKLAIEAKDSIHTDAMRGITEPEAQAAFDRWFNKAYEQLEQSVVVNAIGAGKRKFQADLVSDLEKASLMPLEQGIGQIEDKIAGAFIAGIPKDVLIGLQDDALHDLQLNDLRRETNIKTAQAQEDFGAIEAFINEAQESTKYAKLDARDWASVKSQAKSDFTFNKGLREDAEQRARAESYEIGVDEILFKGTPNIVTKLFTEPRFDPLTGGDKITLVRLAEGIAESNSPDAVNFADDTWVSEFLELSDDPFVEDEELKAFWTEGVNERKLTGTKIKEYWNEIGKRAPNTAAKDGIKIINDAFDKQIKNLEGKKREKKQKQLDELRKDKAKAGVMFNDWLKANPDADAVEIIDYANQVDKIFRSGRLPKSLEEHDEFVNATLNQIQTTGQAKTPLQVPEQTKSTLRAGTDVTIPEPTNDNANRSEFERLTGVILSPLSGNIKSGTDASTEGNYESYKVGRKWWRWYRGEWQFYKNKRKGWVADKEGPK